jgi:Chaperone of endosialidase
MKRHRLALSCALAAFAAFHLDAADAATFTYHGSLQDSGKPAEGSYDLELTLYTAASGGRAVGGPLVLYKVPVHGGSFSTEADFGPLANPTGTAWLDVRVRSAGTREFVVLSARAPVSANANASVCPGAWTLDGNAGTLPGTGLGQNYLGTADNLPLVLAINGAQAASLIPSGSTSYPESANVVLGSAGNFVGSGVGGATVGGGGDPHQGNCGPGSSLPCVNSATNNFATVGGGFFDVAGGLASTVSGGDYNSAGGDLSSVGGGFVNSAAGIAATVAGGTFDFADGSYATVAGGNSNTANGQEATVGGGQHNQANADDSTIAGGNTNSTGGGGAFVGGGTNDVASGGGAVVAGGDTNAASGILSSVVGGSSNSATNLGATVGGGQFNTASGQWSVVGGGGGAYNGTNYPNTAAGDYATVAGGAGNNASGPSGTVGGGFYNGAIGDVSVVAGGENNGAGGTAATVSGGYYDFAEGAYSTVAGGYGNYATGWSSAIAGGYLNVADGDGSFAAGMRAYVRDAASAGNSGTCDSLGNQNCGDYGTFVWSDGSTETFSSSGPRQFLIQAVGGVGINTTPVNSTVELTIAAEPNNSDYASIYLRQSAINAGFLISSGAATSQAANNAIFLIDRYNGTALSHMIEIDAAGNTLNVSGSWTMFSDRRLKRDIAPIEHPLDTFLGLHGQTFEYIDPQQSMAQPGRRMGFIAQDVEQVLPQWVGEDERGYKMVTPTGFEALSVEALRELRAEKDAEIAALQDRLDALTARLGRLEAARGN